VLLLTFYGAEDTCTITEQQPDSFVKLKYSELARGLACKVGERKQVFLADHSVLSVVALVLLEHKNQEELMSSFSKAFTITLAK